MIVKIKLNEYLHLSKNAMLFEPFWMHYLTIYLLIYLSNTHQRQNSSIKQDNSAANLTESFVQSGDVSLQLKKSKKKPKSVPEAVRTDSQLDEKKRPNSLEDSNLMVPNTGK